MADVNQTRAALQRQLAATPYRATNTPVGMRVEYEPIQDGFASDANHTTSRQVYGIDVELRPQHSWAILRRVDSISTNSQVVGPLGMTRQSKSNINRYAYNLVQAGDPQPVLAMIQLVSAVITQHGWKLESVGRPRTQLLIIMVAVCAAVAMIGAVIVLLLASGPS